ncbi:MAG: hypothetical protein M1385_02055 [Candidatus Marsarchaeota archaeon]|nr:hypothetical protein [Candidatus Marsarchaeota archaeon]
MENKKRDLVMLIGSAFVALIFITGYAANGNGGVPNSNSTATKAVKNVTTFFASGASNAIITGYSNTFDILLKNTSAANKTSNILNAYENNGIVSTYNQLNNTYFNVFAQGNYTYNIYQNLTSALGSNQMSFISVAYLKYPKYLTLFANGNKVNVLFSNPTYSFLTSNILLINSSIPTDIDVIAAYNNGSYYVYNNNITIRSG